MGCGGFDLTRETGWSITKVAVRIFSFDVCDACSDLCGDFGLIKTTHGNFIYGRFQLAFD
jgi:hypothetical protein